MNWKAVKGLVIIVSLSLVCPPPSSAVRSAQSKHKSQVSSAGLKDHHRPSISASGPGASSLRHHVDGGQHQQLGSSGIEPALVRLKRIKRQVASIRTLQQPSSTSSSNSKPKYVDGLAKIPEKLDLRPIGLTEGRTPAAPSRSLHEFGGGARVHTEMFRRLEDVNRQLPQLGRSRGLAGKGPSKSNEIAEFHTGHHIQDGGRHRLTGIGNYAQHKHEADNLESAAAAVAALRQRNRKKNKHQKNRSGDFSLKGTRNRNYALASRFRPGDRIQKGETAGLPGRGRGRGHAEEKAHLVAEAKHRTRRGQHSGLVPSNRTGSHALGVKSELERIRRMQRDLMKEISHLEHMKTRKKNRRSASERLSQGQRGVLKAKRK